MTRVWNLLAFFAALGSLALLLYGLSTYVNGGRPRCGICGCLIAPWSAYCPTHLEDPDA